MKVLFNFFLMIGLKILDARYINNYIQWRERENAGNTGTLGTLDFSAFQM